MDRAGSVHLLTPSVAAQLEGKKKRTARSVVDILGNSFKAK
jgi:hypothetical protein